MSCTYWWQWQAGHENRNWNWKAEKQKSIKQVMLLFVDTPSRKMIREAHAKPPFTRPPFSFFLLSFLFFFSSSTPPQLVVSPPLSYHIQAPTPFITKLGHITLALVGFGLSEVKICWFICHWCRKIMHSYSKHCIIRY